MNIARIQRLKEFLLLSTMNHSDLIMTQPSLKDAHIYCIVNNLSSQKYGALLENYIIQRYNYVRNKASSCTGDCSRGFENIEIKTSLGGQTHRKFNFVQIRLSHDISTYLFTAYHLTFENVEDEGELYVFKIPKTELKKLILSHGEYAHGSKTTLGKITNKSFDDKAGNKEYALRPTFDDVCWKKMMLFRIHENFI